MAETKTEMAKSLLVRYIRDQKMSRGDRLPGQDFLRRNLKFGTTTISAAIRELRDDGVVEVQDKIGVFVIDPNANGHTGRTVALTAIHLENSSFYSVLSSLLQVQLMRLGCQMRLFCAESLGRTQCQVDDFPGLRRCIENGEIQGIVHIDDFLEKSLNYLQKKKIPTLMVGGANASWEKCGIFIDQTGTMRMAAEKLHEMGMRRPGLVVHRTVVEDIRGEFGSLVRELWGKTAEPVIFSGNHYHDGGRIAKEFASMSEAKRPDSLIILDDIIGGTLTAELALRLPPEKLPVGAIMRGIQLNIPFALPRKIYYDIDFVDFAARAAELIFKAMKTNILDSGRTIFTPSITNYELKITN